MVNLNRNRDKMRELLNNARTIAVVGHSDSPHRTSYQIANYLRRQGYHVIPVNPTIESVNGDKSYPSLHDVPVHVDIVNVFRRSEYVAGVVDDAIAIGADAIWTQLGVIDTNARDKAIESDLDVAMDLCIKVEHTRLGIGIKSR